MKSAIPKQRSERILEQEGRLLLRFQLSYYSWKTAHLATERLQRYQQIKELIMEEDYEAIFCKIDTIEKGP